MDQRLYNLLLSVGIIALIIIMRWLISYFALSRIKNLKMRYSLRKGTIYLSYIVIIIALLIIWVDEFQSAATFLGLLTAGLAVALRDPIVNFFGWMYIVFTRPFEMGDRIEIGVKKGDVLDVRFFSFTIMEIGAWVDANQSTGRIIHVPNGKVFTEPITNFAQGFPFIWMEIPILVTYDSDWEKAKTLILEVENQRSKETVKSVQKALREGEKKYNIRYSKLTPTIYTSTRPSGILLTLRFLSHTRRQRAHEQFIWEGILREFAKHDDIQFAYPSQAVYVNTSDK